MIALLQRVSHAKVTVGDEVVGQIGAGLLVFLGVEKNDSDIQRDRLLERVLTYRVFEDSAGKMNLSLLDTGRSLLVVSQFTLAADTHTGTRAGFSTAGAPTLALAMYESFVEAAKKRINNVETGRFGANMQVLLENIGPITFHLRVAPTV